MNAKLLVWPLVTMGLLITLAVVAGRQPGSAFGAGKAMPIGTDAERLFQQILHLPRIEKGLQGEPALV